MKYIIPILLILGCVSCSLDTGSNSSGNTTGSHNTDNSNQNNDNSHHNDNSNSSTNSNDGTNSSCSSGTHTASSFPFLWKPVSDSDGNLVILFGSKYSRTFESVVLTRKDGTSEYGVFSGYTNPDRQTWRFSSPGHQYVGDIHIQDLDQECSAFVPDPSIRNE